MPNPVNLPSCFPASREIGSAYALPVLVDLEWYGRTMTSENAGIIHSRSAFQPRAAFEAHSDEVIL